jgi:hypothetical protein
MEFGAPVKLECENFCSCDLYSKAHDGVIFEGFEVDSVTGDIVNPELGLTAFIKSRNEGSDYYKGVFTQVSTVHMRIERQMRKNGFKGVYVPKEVG